MRDLVAGRAVAAAALFDAEAVEPGDPPFHLTRTSTGWVLHGSVAFVPDATAAGRLLVLADGTGDDPVVVALDPSVDGVTIVDRPVLDETRSFASVILDGVAVADDAVARFAGDPDASVRRLLDRAALAVACDSLGLSEAMLAATVAYAGERRQFGRPIGSFQAVKHQCADALVQLTLARELVVAAVRHVADVDDPTASVAVSMAKAYTCAAAVDIVGTALQLHGGIGYTWESGLHVHLKRATLNRSLFGAPTAHRHRLARRYERPA